MRGRAVESGTGVTNSMESQFSESELMVVTAFADFFQKEVPMTRVRNAALKMGFDRVLWEAFVALGGDRVATGEGGGTVLDAVLIGVEAGRRLAPIPYPDVVAAIRLADAAGIDLDDVVVPVVVDDRVPDTHGTLTAAGAAADGVILLTDDRAHLIPLERADNRRTPQPNLGALPMACVRVRPDEAISSTRLSPRFADVWRDDLRLLRAALLVGAGEQALEITLEHLRVREQFGKKIGSFQAIQHRLASCATGLRAARLLVLRGASYTSTEQDRAYHVAVALVCAGDAAELTAREGMQFFGGYGYSIEYDIHLYLRTIKAWRVLSHPGGLHDATPASRWGALSRI